MSDSRPSPFGISARRVLSLSAVRWLALDWHVLAIALLLLGIGLVFVRAMSASDEMFGRDEIGHLCSLGQ